MSFDWFSAVLHCESRRFSSALWELSFIAQQWLFGISNQKTFWGFLVNVKRSLSEPENLKRFFDERWQTELNSHSKLLNLLDKQCKKGRKPVKTHWTQSSAFLSRMETRSVFVCTRNGTFLYVRQVEFSSGNPFLVWWKQQKVLMITIRTLHFPAQHNVLVDFCDCKHLKASHSFKKMRQKILSLIQKPIWTADNYSRKVE